MALNLQLCDPTDHGWVNDDNGRFGIHWTECKPVLEAILEFVTCSCHKSKCGTNQCGCVFINLPCTNLCLCKSCKNSNKDTNIDIEDMFDEDFYDSNDMKMGMTVMEKKMMENCFQMMRITHEKKIMTKAKGNKTCFSKAEFISCGKCSNIGQFATQA